MVYTSQLLSSLWLQGFCTVGAVTFESAAYVARYVLKKMTGPAAADYYTVTDKDTGELHQLLPEYVTMSLKPAIGKNWYEEFNRDVYPDDFVVIRGKKMKPPKYYDRLHDIEQPTAHALLQEARASFARQHSSNATPERLKVRETVQAAKMKFFKREV